MITDPNRSLHSREVWTSSSPGTSVCAEPPRHDATLSAGDRVDHEAALSFADVYEEHVALVWRTARRFGVPDANLDDAVQDVFVVVHHKLAGFEGRSSMRTWIIGIVRRIARDHRPRRDRFVENEDILAELPTAPEHSPSEQAQRAESARLLQRLLDGLDDDKREAFVLAEIEQLTMPEVAEALGINVNTAASRVRAARKDLDAALARLRARREWRNECPE